MARPKYNPETIKKLMSILVKYPDGIWMSKLAREADVPLSTTSYYLDNQISAFIDEQTLGEEREIIRVIKLKPFVFQKLQEGMNLQKIMKIIKLIKDV
jgi:hypothetical protein